MSAPQPKKAKPQAGRRTRAGRPRLGKETGRETILANALPCFARRGYHGVNIRDLAQQAGVNIALANYHFGSKAALWQACLERLQSSASGPLAEIGVLAAAALPYPRRLVGTYASFIRFNADLPDYGLFILQEMLQPGERQDLVKTVLIDPFREAVTPLLSEGVEKGFLRTRDVSLLFFTHSIAISHVVAGQGLLAPFFTPKTRKEQTLKELLAMMVRSATGSLPAEFAEEIETAYAHV